MALVELLKGSHVALRSSLCQPVIGYWLCLGFGCGHVFVYWASDEGLESLLLVLHDYHVSAVFQGSGTFSHEFPVQEQCELSGTLDAGVMPRLERVVAFPRLKVTGFLQPHQHFGSRPQLSCDIWSSRSENP